LKYPFKSQQEIANANNQSDTDAYAPLRSLTMQQRTPRRPIDAIFFIGRMLLLLLLYRPMPFMSIMGISTRSASRLQPIQMAMAAKTTTPIGGRSRTKRQNNSPMSVDVNSILAKITLPQTRSAKVLTVRGNTADRDDKTTGNSNPSGGNNSADKGVEDNNLLSSQDSPMTSPGQAMVRINNTPESDPQKTTQAATAATRSILCGSRTHQITPETNDFQTNDDPSKKTILNK
jgi:hypothetical protein